MSYLTYIYLLPALAIIAWYLRRNARAERRSMDALRVATEAGMLEPPTLHPVIDAITCIGCGSCVAACPEQDSHPVLGMIGKKAWLVGPSNCIGHGACRAACPVDAITLVFGTETRGVDIPVVKPNFETDVPGIFIAGELGGMGLIRNAIEQGRQALQSAGELLQSAHNNEHDIVIVGAGPAGFSASLAAMAANLNAVTIEQEALGGTVAHFPRRKLVMTQPADLPLVGKTKFTEIQKEALVEFWQGVERDTGVAINYNECVTGVEPVPGGSGFIVTTDKNRYNTRTVMLTIGRRGTPRKLGVTGEELPKVVYRLIDPEQYANRRVLVVGGGDSALEAAASVAEEAGTTVTLSYRSGSFSRAKQKNRERIEALARDGNIEVLFNSNLLEIREDSVKIDIASEVRELQNDAVIVSAGGILPTAFLQTIGITVQTKFGTE